MIRQFISRSRRAGIVLCMVLCLTVVGFADTIRLRDGSVIRGEVVGFGDGQFTVLIGSGARGRRSRITLYPEDVESIEFDGATAVESGTPGVGGGNATQPGATTATASRVETGTPAQPSNQPSTSPSAPRSQTLEQTIVRVRADNTTNGWTNSGITVRQGQRLIISATGRVTLGGGRATTPAGVRTIQDTGKLMRDEATGALIAVIGDNNDDFIFIGARREFTAQRDGVLFLGVNEGNLNDNTGTYDVTVAYEPR